MRASARRSSFDERAPEHAQPLRQAEERLARERRPLARAHGEPLDAVLEEEAVERRLVLQVDVLLAAPRAVERRLRDVEVAALDELRHLPVEEREEQRPDVAAVDVGVGHQDDLVVAELLDVEAARSPMPQPSAAMSVPISALDSILSRRARSTFRIFPLSGRIA